MQVDLSSILATTFFNGSSWERLEGGNYIGRWQGHVIPLSHEDNGAYWKAKMTMFGHTLDATRPTAEETVEALRGVIQEELGRFLSTDPALSHASIAEVPSAVAQEIGVQLHYDLEAETTDEGKIRVLQKTLGALLDEKRFGIADRVLRNLSPFTLGLELSLAILSTTEADKNRLESRTKFQERLIRAFGSNIPSEPESKSGTIVEFSEENSVGTIWYETGESVAFTQASYALDTTPVEGEKVNVTLNREGLLLRVQPQEMRA